MKTKYNTIALLLLVTGLIALLASCRKCTEGCDTLYTTTGAALAISDSNVSLKKAISTTSISFEKIVTKSDGERDCKYKNEVSCNSDGLSAKNLHLFCNKELVLNNVSYPMNTDLLLMPELVKFSNSNAEKLPFVLLQTDSDFPAGRYHFLLQGKTNEGKIIEDIEVISWE